MADLPEIDAVRLERDEWRERALRAARELADAQKLLVYADEAIMAEYRLRCRSADICGG